MLRRLTILEVLVISAILALVLLCAGFIIPIQVAWYVLIGWFKFLARVVPQVRLNIAALVTAAVAAAALCVGLHYFCRWLYGRGKADEAGERPWKATWSLGIAGAVLIMFVAGISAIGATHQIGWLATTDQPLMTSSSSARHRAHSRNNLKLLRLAVVSYEDAATLFPAGSTFDRTGRALHGWQTTLLPHIDRPDLYKAIDHSQPWDAAANRVHLSEELPVYQNPRIPERIDRSGYALSHYASNVRVVGPGPALRMSDLSDGASTTILFGEVNSRFKPWGHPFNHRDPALGINASERSFGSPFRGGAHVVFADGRAVFISNDVDPTVLKALATPAGGESIDDY